MGVIHRAGHHPDERNRHIVGDLVVAFRTPFQLLQSGDSLEIKYIRVSPLDSRRFVNPVEIDQQMVLGGDPRHPFAEPHGLLVVPVDEIDLESLEAHLGVVAHRLLRVLHDAVVACPKDDSDPLPVSIGDEFLKVDVGVDQEEVSLGSLRPSLVHDDVLDAVRRREVYVVLVGLRVDSRAEIHSVKIPVVPPVPGHLPRFYPAPVSVLVRRSGKLPDQIHLHQRLGVLSDPDDLPRELLSGLDLGDVVGVVHILIDVHPVRPQPDRIWRADAFQFLAALPVKEHSRIAGQI